MDIREEIDKRIYQLYMSLVKKSNVLEIGVGGRPNNMVLFQQEHRYEGTDINAGASWTIPELWTLDIEKCFNHPLLNTIPKWDVLIANQVMEHVKHPQIAMFNCYDILVDGGIFFMSTPFFYRIHESDKDGGETIEMGVNDYWRFTPNGYRVLLSDAGFEEYYITQIGEELLNPNVIVAIAIKHVGQPQKENKDLWIPKIELPTNWKEMWTERLKNYKSKKH